MVIQYLALQYQRQIPDLISMGFIAVKAIKSRPKGIKQNNITIILYHCLLTPIARMSKHLAMPLIYQMLDHLPVFSASTAANSLQAQQFERQTPSEVLWKAIFKDDKWIKKVIEYGGRPVIVGPNLDIRKVKRSQPAHMALFPGGLHGESIFETKLFFESLREGYRYKEKKQEIRYPEIGIILKINAVLMGHGEITLERKYMRSLFSFNQERLNSQYSFYQGEETRIYTLGHPNIIGMGGPTSTPGALPPICAINLFISGQKVQYYLKQIDCPKVIPIVSEDNVRGSVIAFRYCSTLGDSMWLF